MRQEASERHQPGLDTVEDRRSPGAIDPLPLDSATENERLASSVYPERRRLAGEEGEPADARYETSEPVTKDGLGDAERGRSLTLTDESELASAVGILTRMALQMDDPVQALEDGTDALAEALAIREQESIRHERQADAMRRQQAADQSELQRAYRHARLHRIGELIDLGYGLDQAVIVTNGNERDIRQRALAAGRQPDQVIYEYAVRHGYRRRPAPSSVPRSAPPSSGPRPSTALERLASLGDDEFADATRGDRWERLLRG